MDIAFKCYKCNQHIVIDEAGAGDQVKCPTCQAELVVPQAKLESSKPLKLAAFAKLMCALVRNVWRVAVPLSLREAYRAGRFEFSPSEFAKLDVAEDVTDRYIPANVKLTVWRRDQGKCVQCSSNEKIEYDIIPLSGGSNTERNIQLLCQKCNCEKAALILALRSQQHGLGTINRLIAKREENIKKLGPDAAANLDKMLAEGKEPRMFANPDEFSMWSERREIAGLKKAKEETVSKLNQCENALKEIPKPRYT